MAHLLTLELHTLVWFQYSHIFLCDHDNICSIEVYDHIVKANKKVFPANEMVDCKEENVIFDHLLTIVSFVYLLCQNGRMSYMVA